jgi:very-short-patch-repair endonuclease
MPPKVSTPKMMHRAGELRQNQTEAEAKLWAHLRAHRMAGVQFRRQHALGNYIVDFCSPRRKLIIELDAVSTWIKLSMILKGPGIWNPRDTTCFGSGIMML